MSLVKASQQIQIDKQNEEWIGSMKFKFSLVACLFVSFNSTLFAQFNYDESKVPKYTPIDPLVSSKGEKIDTKEKWMKIRRPEILKMIAREMFGEAPVGRPKIQRFEVLTKKNDALNGLAIRKEIKISLTERIGGPSMVLLLYIPAKVKGPVPAFIGLNFFGNHSATNEKDVLMNRGWMRNDKKRKYFKNKATEETRGVLAYRWPAEMVLKRGYALGTIYCGDIDPDYHDEFKNGIHPHYYKKGQTHPEAHQWGTIATWAWGLSRALDYFEQEDLVDAKKVAVLGHSRLGKTALWAGATDQRFALVISNNSGCGGAALSKRVFGETVKRINTSFPHWFCGNFKKYNGNEKSLPFDQHMLISLMAPRPVYVASAEKDRWADPRGEYLAAKRAGPVYKLFGLPGLPGDGFPKVNTPLHGTVGYHIRTGEHEVNNYDWDQYLNFADKHLR